MSSKVSLYLAWLVSLSAMVGSLYFSLILKLAPCDLCWYQRIFIYPLVFMIPVAILKEDKNISLYSLVLLVPGAILASYHTLLYHGVIEKAIIPCNEQVSCTSKELELFGFMGIPLMSLLTFVFMIVLMGRLYWKEKRI